MATPAMNTICLWYNGDAEVTARFYAKAFPIRPSVRCMVHRETFLNGKDQVLATAGGVPRRNRSRDTRAKPRPAPALFRMTSLTSAAR